MFASSSQEKLQGHRNIKHVYLTCVFLSLVIVLTCIIVRVSLCYCVSIRYGVTSWC